MTAFDEFEFRARLAGRRDVADQHELLAAREAADAALAEHETARTTAHGGSDGGRGLPAPPPSWRPSWCNPDGWRPQT